MNFNQAPAFFQQQQQVSQQHHQLMASSGSRGVDGWANDFSNLHISQQQPQGHVVNGGNWHEQFLQQQSTASSLAPSASMITSSQISMNYNSSMQQPMQFQQQQEKHSTLSKQQEDRLFEEAFFNIEKQFSQPAAEVVDISKPILEDQQESQEPEKVDENVELSRIANHIVNNIDPSNEKLKSSNFMMLMQQLSQKQVRLEGDKFVDSNGIDVREAPAPVVTETEFSPAVAGGQTIDTSTSINDSFGNPDHKQDSTQTGLPDPLEFLEAQAHERGETNPTKIYSPLEFAKILAPQGVPHPSNWEEKYHDYI